ncbi:MAG TPA: PilZ domain-containing protein [Holophaga sp.]|jgi:c-di-GMP-binding flagellar brake protein YcgR|nr:PilZ domain-containing protein [Holophaga sp.]
MENHPERRDSRRIIVGPEFTIRFVVKGHVFQGIRITNLSAGGCFAVVGSGDAKLFDQGTVMEGLAFENPQMHAEGITGEVRYVLGGSGSGTGFDFVGLGVRFVSIPESVSKVLQAFVVRSANLPGV